MGERCTRRALLRAGAGALAAGTLATRAAADGAQEHQNTQPPYVSLTYDEELIREYQPLLVLSQVKHKPTGYHAAVLRSSESDVSIIVGFNKYLVQEGVDVSGADSHLGDREPVYIYVDEAAGEPLKVQYSAYHWYSNSVRWRDLSTDSTGKRAKLRVIPRWHHHMTYHGSLEGETIPVRNLLESYPDWLRNGLSEEIHPGAVYNAGEEMQHREYWWRDGSQTLLERILARVYLSVGIRGASETDLDGGLW